MPTELMRKLKNKEQPKKNERLQMIKLLVSEILTVCPFPGKKHLSEVARKMVVTYPSSFKDVIEGEVVGSGYDSLTKQLVSRVDNPKRGNNYFAQKRQVSSACDGTPHKKLRIDSYGCVNWLLNTLPPGETNESQKFKQEELKKMFFSNSSDSKNIQMKMTTTFFSQRKDITSGEEVTDLEREWPYLFEPCGMRSHFKELTGVYVTEEAIESKSERVVLFLKSFEKRNKTEDILADVEVDKQKHLKANLPASLLLLLRHFNEDADQMFHKMDEVCLAFEVDCAKLPKTPCIIVCGKSPVTAETFMVSADQCIVNGSVTNFGDALFLMFALYYCLNISYPATLGTTLEFLQRCIFRINPDKGTKVEKGSKKAVNAKVLSLIQKISDYEWRE
ncbi:uncharacterized protein LOC124483350 isoform X3 [Hypomesus transpacificus]|nr:uncharacterized protein LOC124483350 isoform X3 [Hypomesus transpacificus]